MGIVRQIFLSFVVGCLSIQNEQNASFLWQVGHIVNFQQKVMLVVVAGPLKVNKMDKMAGPPHRMSTG